MLSVMQYTEKRKNALFGERLDIDIDNMFYDVSESIVLAHDKNDFDSFQQEMLRVAGIRLSSQCRMSFLNLMTLQSSTKFMKPLCAQYTRKNAKIAERAMPQIKHVFETMPDKYQNIVFPLTDGQ